MTNSWTCRVCNFKIQSDAKEAHLSSDFHSNHLHRKAPPRSRAPPTPPPEEENFPVSAVPEDHEPSKEQITKINLQPWTCKSCDVTLPFGRKESHESGKRHKTNVNAHNWTCAICDVTLPPGSQNFHEASKKHITKFKLYPWSCKICDVKLTLGDQEAHEVGKKHLAKVAALAEPKPPVATLAPLVWTCTACNVTLDEEEKESHRAGNRHKARVSMQIWTCTVCNVTLSMQSRGSHEASKQHTARASNFEESEDTGIGGSANTDQQKSKWWTCNACNITMYAYVQEAHEGGKCTAKRTPVVKTEASPKKCRGRG